MFKQTTLLSIDGVWCDDYELGVYAMTDNKDFFGISRTAIQQETNKLPIVYGFKDNPITSFKIILVRVKNGVPIAMDNAFRNRVSQYLFKKKVAAISFDNNSDLIYYGYFSGGQRQDFGSNHGYIECDLTFVVPYGVTKPIINEVSNWSGESNYVELECLSNVDEYVYPILEIEPLDGNTNVSIINHTLDIHMNFKNIPVGSMINIDNELRQVECTNVYKFENFNRKWMKLLGGGGNYIEVKGKCIVRFINQFAMMESSERFDLQILNKDEYYGKKAVCGRFLCGELCVQE